MKKKIQFYNFSKNCIQNNKTVGEGEDMNAAVNLFENKTVRSYLKSQFRVIRDYNIDPGEILTQLMEAYNEKYCFTRISNLEICVKADKKKNLQHLEAEIREQLSTFINRSDVNINFLFKIMKGPNELIIRAKRYNG